MNSFSIYQTLDNHAEVKLERKPTVAKIATTSADGTTYLTEYFNPDATTSVGYCVNSELCTEFRPWATQTLFNS